jgi:hypothetical protein
MTNWLQLEGMIPKMIFLAFFLELAILLENSHRKKRPPLPQSGFPRKSSLFFFLYKEIESSIVLNCLNQGNLTAKMKRCHAYKFVREKTGI